MKTIHDPAYGRLIATLRARRLELGLSQEEVGKRMDASRTFVVRVEQKERRLDALELYRMLKALKMRLADIENALIGERL
jgi:transcriptional regulator with XRE-family HTH domain